jgi:hypothetical protein
VKLKEFQRVAQFWPGPRQIFFKKTFGHLTEKIGHSADFTEQLFEEEIFRKDFLEWSLPIVKF